MASTRGPIPKRDAERAGHNSKAEAADKVEVRRVVKAPPPKPEWEAETVAWYESLADSGQSRFYEPTDWQHALIVGDLLDAFRTADRPSAEMARAMFAEMDKLGVTESSRRRMRIEVHRPGKDEDDDAPAPSEAVLDRFRKMTANGDG